LEHLICIYINQLSIVNNILPKFVNIFRARKLTWKAIESSGYIKKRSDLKVNTYLGASLKGYKTKSDFNEMPIGDWQFNMLNNKDFSAARVSYHLGLNGEALSISTACSTSLVAIIEACKNLQLGTCNLAIAGGASLSTEDAIGYLFEEGMILSKDGHCRVFDAEASGTVPSSGVGVVVLKRFSEALADQDDIIAVIKGYATNNDGNRKVGFSAPSVDGQKDCILDAQLSARVSADSVSYVECHGTGTLLGDPIEVAALHEAFTANSNGVYDCQLGSVKANIGHADVAAGIAGFIKTCMMLRNKKLPAQINYVTPNVELSIDSTNFSVEVENQDWLADKDVPRRAGVSSFGIGGTNAHLILEEFSSFNLNKPTEQELSYFIPISANSASSCIAYANVIQKYLMNSNCSFSTVAKVLQENREYFNYRVCIQANSNVNTIEQLAHVLEPVNIRRGIKLAFMFTGQGFQYSKMAYELYINFPYFKAVLDQCAKLINEIENYNILEIIFSDDVISEKLKTTQYAQPALFVICYAITKLYGNFGIEPSVMIGHSVGEIVAATLSGVFSLEDAIKIILMRAAVMQSASPGAMLAVKASESVVERLLIPGIVIAVINSPVSTVIAGEHDKINDFKELLSENNVSFSDVFTSHAFHSPSMQEPASKFLTLLKSINFKSPNIPLISNTSGNFINNDEATSPMYWSRHIIRPVHFSKGIESINSSFDNIICLEIGPGNGLCSFVKQIPNLSNIFHVEQSLPGYAQKTQLGLSELDIFMNSIANLWTRGCDVIWPARETPNYGQSLIPTYQFDKLECSIKVMNKTEVQYPITYDLSHDILSFAYKQLFGDREVNENKSFFEMGIDSLSIIRLIGLISVELKITLTVQEVFINDTPAKLRTYCAHLVNNKNNAAVTVLEEGEI